jgi:protein-disulfide isomerase
VLYLSPDQRFLLPELLDTRLDPGSERKRLASETERQLLVDESPSRGQRDSTINVVEFADFQCPFCKRFDQFLKALGPEGASVKVVFKQLPLSIHSWARRAALVSVCAGFQKQDAFWDVHDFLFANQQTITSETLDGQVAAFLAKRGDIDRSKLQGCIVDMRAEEVLQRDFDLARHFHIDGTPTIFINGIRASGIGSVDELRSALAQARNSSEREHSVAWSESSRR